MTPRWSYEIDYTGNPPVLVIHDLFDENKPSMSVTNGIELVINETQAQLKAKHMHMPTICVYQDTEGCWDGVKLTQDGRFRGFYALAPMKPRREVQHISSATAAGMARERMLIIERLVAASGDRP